MKKQLSVFVTLALFILFSGLAMAQTKKEVIKTESIKVGIHCPSGKAAIESELMKTPGVKEVTVSMETKLATIKYIDGKTTKEQLIAQIEKLGYSTDASKSSPPSKSGCAKSCQKTCGH